MMCLQNRAQWAFYHWNDKDDLGKCFYASVVFSMQALHQVTMAAVPASWALCKAPQLSSYSSLHPGVRQTTLLAAMGIADGGERG